VNGEVPAAAKGAKTTNNPSTTIFKVPQN
jgi:hypothetical protein